MVLGTLFEIRPNLSYHELAQVDSRWARDTTMKLVALCDIHGAYESVDQILKREEGFDAVVIGGDLTTRGTETEARDVLKRYQRYGRPLFVVAGNMDLPSFDRLFDELNVGINGRGMFLNDVGLFGVSGSPFTPLHTPYEITEEEILLRAESAFRDVQSASVKVFVPHAPPYKSTLDKILVGKHVGSTAVRSFIVRRQPDVVICGHIHESRGVDRIGGSQIVNCGPSGEGYYAIISLDQEIRIELKG
jgi:Icc-related predicted phosphoesterase